METKIFIKTEGLIRLELKEESELVAPWVPTAVKKEEESLAVSPILSNAGKNYVVLTTSN